MEVIVQPDAAAVCRFAASVVARSIERKPSAVLGLATGRTMVDVYAELVRLHRRGLSCAQARTFNLDEYVGVSPDHPASYHRFMQKHLFDATDFQPAHVALLDGLAADVQGECERFEQSIAAAGGIDLQLLGIGGDGHIGFNEPTSSLASRTRIKTLTLQTREAYADTFGGVDRVPRHVLTMGVGTILDARACLLLATGSGKARAVAAAVEGPLAAMVPASALQLHANATIVVDEDAASKLTHLPYYREVYEGKPGWQRETENGELRTENSELRTHRRTGEP